MNLSKTFSSLMTNKYFLYFIVVVSAFNIIGYLTMNNMEAVIFFALVGFLMFNFSKNMTIVLLVSIIATNLLMVSNPLFSEGFQEGIRDKNRDPNKGLNSTDGALPDHFKDRKSNKGMGNKGMGNKGMSKKEPFELSPAPVKKNSHIDYATTLEDAYSNLEQMLGSDGLNNLTEDTKKLMSQQTQLFKSMENITPLLAEAQKMMKGMDMETLNKFSNSAKPFNKSEE